ncbi:hypothetical protein CKAH01_12638 [Colletotrichum kahawae]|uniref:Uncharacterized protein n=1 Tax=Colletotrichum kahawae TaxID=34407 RepID=A0AAD9YR76_COLKA|nr:hypothetical protein CKAH01_12638 [Colletotrichum kahawae]
MATDAAFARHGPHKPTQVGPRPPDGTAGRPQPRALCISGIPAAVCWRACLSPFHPHDTMPWHVGGSGHFDWSAENKARTSRSLGLGKQPFIQ